jgi:polyhydroxyalkanoate synthase subunit PhaC
MAKNVQIIEYPGELGVCLQHLGILVGRHAQVHVWPEILSWLKTQTSSVRA